MTREKQRDRILALLKTHEGEWVSLGEILNLRQAGFKIENRIERLAIAGAFEAAAFYVSQHDNLGTVAAQEIRALTPADAQAALDRLRTQANEAGSRIGFATARAEAAAFTKEDLDEALRLARLDEANLWDTKYPRAEAIYGTDWAKGRIAELERTRGGGTG